MSSLAPLASTATRKLDVYGAALRGDPVRVRHADGRCQPLNSARWLGPARDADLSLLAHVHSPALDVGCGPGRLVAAVAGRGLPSLGVDVHDEAVRLTRATGSLALQRSVFDAVPGAGRWGSLVLADGNIGIGGDPHRLLARAAELLRPQGRAVVEVAAPGVGLVIEALRLEHPAGNSSWFRWASVGVEALDTIARCAGMRLDACWPAADTAAATRWFAILTKC